MTRTLLLCTVLLAACDPLYGTVPDRAPCATSADCPAGQFCASTGSGRVCWADAVPPAVGSPSVTCSTTPCLRDAVLTVEAQVSDDQELGPVTVTLDLDGGQRQVPMVRQAGALHRATLPLAEWPVAGLTATVTATVRAVDGARNPGATTAAAGHRPSVTRLRAPLPLAAGVVVVPTAPALAADGTVVVGGSTGRLYALPPGAAGVVASGAALGAAIVHPPAIGRQAVWVAAGSRLFALAADLGTVLNGAGYDTGGAIAGPPALTAAVPTAASPEVAFVGSTAGRLVAVKADAVANGVVDITRSIGVFGAGPILTSDATVHAVTGTTAPASATMRAFSFDGALGEGASRVVGQVVSAPLAAAVTDGGIPTSASIWTGTADLASSSLQETKPDGTAGTSIPLGASVGGGAVVLATGEVAVCVGDALHLFTAAGAPAWGAPTPLDGAGLTPLVLAGPAQPTTLLVPTRAGSVHAIRAQDGATLWSVSLTVNVELREGAVAAAPGARTSTAWFTSADGQLHGLVVDGALDASAPWPKAWHDGRNSGNLAAAP